MRLLDLDTLADRLVGRSQTTDLTSAQVLVLRDAILFSAVLDILDSLGGTLGQLTGRRLSADFGDGTGLRAEAETMTGVDKGLDGYVTTLIRQGSAVFPTQFTLQAIYATRSVTALVADVAGADDEYAPPADLLDLLCVVTALAVRQPRQAEFVGGEQIIRRVWAEVRAAAQSLPAY